MAGLTSRKQPPSARRSPVPSIVEHRSEHTDTLLISLPQLYTHPLSSTLLSLLGTQLTRGGAPIPSTSLNQDLNLDLHTQLASNQIHHLCATRSLHLSVSIAQATPAPFATTDLILYTAEHDVGT